MPRTQCSLLRSAPVVVAVVWAMSGVTGSASQAQTPRHPATVTAAESVVLTNAWAFMAQNDLQQAEARARQVLLLNPHNFSARALLIEVGIARTGISGGMSAYDEWTGGRVEEPAAVRRLAQAFLHEVAFGPESLYSLDALGVLADLGDDKAGRRMKTAAETAGLAEVRMAAARGNEEAVTRLAAVVGRALPGLPQALQALGESRSATAIPAIRGRLTDPMSEVRGAAVEALGKTGGAAVIADLVPFLSDSSLHVQIKAATALYALGHSGGDPLLNRLAQSDNSGDRRAAAQAMAVRPGAGWQTLVATLASDPDEDIRLSAARLMAQFDPDQARRVAESLAGSSDAYVRAEATRLLISDMTQDLKTLRMTLLDTDKTVAIAAARAILMAGR